MAICCCDHIAQKVACCNHVGVTNMGPQWVLRACACRVQWRSEQWVRGTAVVWGVSPHMLQFQMRMGQRVGDTETCSNGTSPTTAPTWTWFSGVTSPTSVMCQFTSHSTGLMNIKKYKYTQKCAVSGLCPLLGVLKCRKHNISETGSVSILVWWEGDTCPVGPWETTNLNHWTTHVKFKPKLYCDRRSVGHFVLISGPSLEQMTRFYSSSYRTPSLTRGRICNLQCNHASSSSSYIATDGQSASSSWCRAPLWSRWPDFTVLHIGRPLWREDGSVICSVITQVQVILRPTVSQPLSWCRARDQILIFFVWQLLSSFFMFPASDDHIQGCQMWRDMLLWLKLNML
jgi:hypothetical protein